MPAVLRREKNIRGKAPGSRQKGTNPGGHYGSTRRNTSRALLIQREGLLDGGGEYLERDLGQRVYWGADGGNVKYGGSQKATNQKACVPQSNQTRRRGRKVLGEQKEH